MSGSEASYDGTSIFNIGISSSKFAAQSNVGKLKGKLNLTKLTADRRLIKAILPNRQHIRNKKAITELRSILKKVALQVSSPDNNLDDETVNALIAVLIGRISTTINQAASKKENQSSLIHASFPAMDDFSCQRCYELLYNPVTLPCGHTFCHTCICSIPMKKCIVCSKALSQDEPVVYRHNIILEQLLQKWHPSEWRSRSFTIKGMLLLNKKQYKEAVDAFTEALSLTPSSHLARLNRAKAYYFMDLLDDALEDAIKVCQVAHTWPEAYYVKGEILDKLDFHEEALVAFIISMVLDPAKECARVKAKKVVAQVVQNINAEQNEDSTNKDISTRNCSSPHKRSCTSPTTPHPTKQLCYNPDDPSISDNSPNHKDVFESQLSFSPNPNTHVTSRVDSEETCKMGSCASHTHFPVDLSYDEIRIQLEETPMLDDKGAIIPADLPSELEREVDEILFNADNPVTRDLNILCHMQHHKQADEREYDELGSLLPVRKIDRVLVDAGDFECSLCMRLLYDPVCTPCGHTFCQLCIERCLDHNPTCPLCKQSMRHYLATSTSLDKLHPTCDYVTKAIIREYLAAPFKERERQHEDEIAELNASQPIFVCIIAFPSVPCPLHIFEPRYRLMLRRCLEHNEREFGMCMPIPGKPHHEIGTLLKVRDVSFFSDGRSVIDCVGFRRFRTSDCQVQDGYNVAKITYITDAKITDGQTARLLLNKVYNEATAWFVSLPAETQARISQHFGGFPAQDDDLNTENGPDWLWWLLAVLPVEDRVKATILGNNQLCKRLVLLQKIFTILKKRNTSS